MKRIATLALLLLAALPIFSVGTDNRHWLGVAASYAYGDYDLRNEGLETVGINEDCFGAGIEYGATFTKFAGIKCRAFCSFPLQRESGDEDFDGVNGYGAYYCIFAEGFLNLPLTSMLSLEAGAGLGLMGSENKWSDEPQTIEDSIASLFVEASAFCCFDVASNAELRLGCVFGISALGQYSRKIEVRKNAGEVETKYDISGFSVSPTLSVAYAW